MPRLNVCVHPTYTMPTHDPVPRRTHTRTGGVLLWVQPGRQLRGGGLLQRLRHLQLRGAFIFYALLARSLGMDGRPIDNASMKPVAQPLPTPIHARTTQPFRLWMHEAAVGGVAIAEMLFCTSLLALVGAGTWRGLRAMLCMYVHVFPVIDLRPFP